MSKLSEQAARKIVGEYGGPRECPWCSVHSHRDVCTFGCAEARKLAAKHSQQVESTSTIIATEYAPVTRLLEDIAMIELDVQWQDSNTGNAISAMKHMQKRAQKLLDR